MTTKKISNFLIFSSLAFLLSFFGACKSEEKKIANPFNKVDSLEKLVQSKVKKGYDSVDIKSVLTLAKAYQDFAFQNSDDERAPECLFRCAQLMEGMLDDKEKAIDLYLKITKQYPKAKKAGAAYFFLGNSFHSVGDTAQANLYLDSFLIKFPKHPLHAQALDLKNYINTKSEDLKIPQ